MDNKSKERLSLYFCGEEYCFPGHFFGPAVRPHYLLHVVLDGKGIFRKDNQTHTLKKGDAFLISPLESTYYQADESQPWHYAWVGFDGCETDSILNNTCFSNSCVFLCPSDSTTLELICIETNKLIATFLTPDHSPLTLLGHFYTLLGLMKGAPPPSLVQYSDLYLKRALDYIHNNYSYPIRIADMASFIGIDRTYLYRIFIQEEAISPKQYLLRFRLRTAARMLRSPQYSVTEIAYSCGFKDAAAFCNQFKKTFDITPKKFRDILKDERTQIGFPIDPEK